MATGSLIDISYSAARVADCSLQPEPGDVTEIRLEVPGVGIMKLTGRVLRCEDTGFALDFCVEDDSERERIDRLSVLLFAASTPLRGK